MSTLAKRKRPIMPAWKINLNHSLLQILAGVLIYVLMPEPEGEAQKSITALIPAFFGVICLAMVPMMRKGNSAITHVVVGLSFLFLLAMGKPASALDFGNLATHDYLMVFSIAIAAIACFLYVKSFMAAKAARAAQQES